MRMGAHMDHTPLPDRGGGWVQRGGKGENRRSGSWEMMPVAGCNGGCQRQKAVALIKMRAREGENDLVMWSLANEAICE